MNTVFEIFGSRGQVIAIMRAKVLNHIFTPAPQTLTPMGQAIMDLIAQPKAEPTPEPVAETRTPFTSEIMAALSLLTTRKDTPPAPTPTDTVVTMVAAAAVAEMIDPTELVKTFTPAPSKKDAARYTQILHIVSQWDAGKKVDYDYNANVYPAAKTITIFGSTKINNRPFLGVDEFNRVRFGEPTGPERKEFRRSFQVGDEVVYGGTNVKYLGKILSVTEKGVKIDTGSNKNVICKLYEFIDRNKNLDLAEVHRKNLEFMD